MEWEDFTSPAYKLETPAVASSRMLNVMPELIEKGPRAGKFRLRGIPGLKPFTTLPDAPMRCLLDIDSGNRLFANAGSTVYEVFADGTYAALTGSIAMSSHPSIMVTNGFQLAIASGGQLYLATGGTPVGAVAPVNFTDGSPVRAATITFLDNYFIAALIDSKQVVISGLAPDGHLWDPGDAKIKEGYPDNISRIFADNEYLFVFGFDSMEAWVNTGGLFPFERANQMVYKVGCSAPFSVAGTRGFRFWLWRGSVYSAYGLSPERVSDYGVEQAILTYGNTDDAEGWCQTIGGHVLYVLSFPNAKRTWVYDASVKAWHERGFYDVTKGEYDLYRGRVYAEAFHKHLVGDPYSGAIYELDPNTYTDAGGAMLRRERVCPYITQEMKNLRYNRLTLDMDTGIGLDVADNQPGNDPQVVMRYSDDRGKKWGNERTASAGKIGDTTRRVIFRQNGSSRLGKVFDVVFTDPCPFTLNTAYLEIGGPEAGR